MTRKDYKLIASAFEIALRDSPDRAATLLPAHVLAELLAQENPNFNAARFLKACGATQEPTNV